MFYNEAYEERKALEEGLMKRWHKAIETNGIKDEHVARTTAILLENYFNYLNDDPKLIAEDQIQTGNFTGVNLAILGLIARVIPQLIGLELVGSQAMPTPQAPIFTMRWYKNNNKGMTAANDEMWVSPTPAGTPLGVDPYFTSQQIRQEAWAAATDVLLLKWANVVNLKGYHPLLYSNSAFVTCYDASGNVLTTVSFTGDYNTSPVNITGTPSAAFGAGMSIVFRTTSGGTTKEFAARSGGADVALSTLTVGGVAVASATIDYEYKPEAEGSIPEIDFEITAQNVSLIRRQLRGRYTLDAAYDLKKYHGIDLESELLNMMKQELMAEINREIITDLRLLSSLSATIDLNTLPAGNPGAASQVSINANYDDAKLAILDAIEKMCARIWNVGRRGWGNWVLGNPETLSFLNRTPGFVGSGVSYSGRDLAFAGSLGGKIKVYHDPLYPKNELLIGYKGNSAIDSGYVYCPYLPITATPTLLDPETGNPSKLYYTRYGKTFYDRGNADGTPKNLILMGNYQYARLTIAGLPTIFQ